MREHKKWWRMPWPRSKKDGGIVERRGTSRSPMPLFLSCVGDIAQCSIGLCFITLIVLHFITRSSWSSNLSGCSEWKGTSSNSNVKDYIPHWGKDFQTKSILVMIRDDVLLDNRTWWIHKVVVRSYWRGAEKNNTLLGIRSTLMIHECY
jgi:hypothetical protein